MIDWSLFLVGLLWAAVALVVLFGGVFALSFVTGKHAVVDIFWGPAFGVAALATYVHASFSDGDAAAGVDGPPGAVALLTLLLTWIWALRLGGHIFLRSRGKGEDPRYEDLQSRADGNPQVFMLRKVYLTQAAVAWFVSLPIQAAMATSAGFGWLTLLGLLVWALGMFFETVGDWQLEQFKKDPSNKGEVLNSGLWRYTRHPNYFGDACVMVGLFLVAVSADAWIWVLVLSPVAMVFNLAKGTGAALLEKDIEERRPGYADYIKNTSGFVPLPPKTKLAKEL
ncbi:DUF1295 domain-containing protein [Nocardioidaceae bacterium]|nr:DUF1295 domain-containing protein [Nocardioidaceae bacterium]